MCRCTETLPSYSNTQVRKAPFAFYENKYLPFFRFVFFYFLSSPKETMSPCSHVSSVLKINSPKYQTVPVVLNSVPYPLNILNRNTLGESWFVFDMWESPVYTCLSLLSSSVSLWSRSLHRLFLFSLAVQHFGVADLQLDNVRYASLFTLQYSGVASSPLPSAQPSHFAFKSVTERI